MNYREEIVKRMAEIGWSQADLAIQSGISPSTLSRFFRGSDLDVPQLISVAGALDRKPGDLLERSEVDPHVYELSPIVLELEGVANGHRAQLIAALAEQAKFMKGWMVVANPREEPAQDTKSAEAAYNPRSNQKTVSSDEPAVLIAGSGIRHASRPITTEPAHAPSKTTATPHPGASSKSRKVR